MQHGKCCYCEMSIPDEGHLKAVEHFRPKSIFKSLTNDWENLLLACPQCNGKKSNKFPLALSNKVKEAKVLHTKYDALKNRKVRTLLIDPTKIDPEEHLDFKCRDPLEADFGLICPKKASKYGKHTIKVVGLYDGFYLRRHRTYLRKTLLPAYFRMSEAADHDDQNTLDSHKRDFEAYMSASSEWSGLARAFARQYGLDKYDINIPNN